MIFDGKQFAALLAAELKKEVATLPKTPVLGVCIVGENPVSGRYVGLKKQVAQEIGIQIQINQFPSSISTEDLVSAITEHIKNTDGYIVQLPLPTHIDRSAVLDAVPIAYDIDMLSCTATQAYYKGVTHILPPVVGVCAEILSHHAIPLKGKKTVVIGNGQLVGKPVAHWLRTQGAEVVVVERDDAIKEKTIDAEIIVLGAGAPGILTPDMISEGVCILDAGTSEAGGSLKGDADPHCAEKASLFTPVPGGIGPVTVVMLLKNLITLAQKH
ncbi:MAG: tetrahydrofolate dehydrogenase/cyclohydrolase catalytic domain-containing protein [Patescibacteria group bacterium UBA2163]